MKAFAIKNKEGKYLDNCQDFETNNICDARLFNDYKEALSFSPKDCEVVEITIAEGDLGKENKQLKENLIEMEKSKLRWENKYFILEQQLAEKDKEIKKLKRYSQLELAFTPVRCDGKTFTKLNVIQDFKNSIRHEVCDEIRQAFNKEDFWLYGDNNKIISIHEDKFNAILDQIEKGE